MATTVAQHSVATFTSPVNGTTPIDANTVRGNDNTTRAAYNDHDADPGIHVQSSTLASRPVAGTAGRKWITEDSGVYTLWFDDGTNWHPVSSENIALTVLAGENLVKGDVVKVTGWNNGQDLPEVVKTTSAADTAFAVITATVSSGSMGYATNTGIVQDVNTAAYSVGTILYANGSGGFTSTKPTSGHYQPVAYVLRANASNGVYYVEFSTPRIVERSDNTASTIVLRDSNGDFSAGTITATAVNATTLDLTNLEVTNIKAKDGTQAIAIADTTGKLTISDGVLLSALTASQAVFTDGSKNLVSNAITGTGNVVMSASPTLTGTVTAATLNATTLGGTLSTAAQPNVTSVGTLGSLTVSGTSTLNSVTVATDGQYAGNYRAIGFSGNVNGKTRIFATTNDSDDLYLAAGTSRGITMWVNGSSANALRLDSSGNLAVDTNTLYVDATNNRVGVGTASPATALDVVGGTQITSSGSTTALTLKAPDNVGQIGLWSTTSGTQRYAIYLASGTDFTLRDSAAATDRIRLDASGNLGLGVTPSAWWSNDKAAQILGGAVWAYNGDTANVNLSANVYQNSSNVATYIGTGTATRYAQESGAHKWYAAPSGTAGNAITFTQAMTLDASGNLGIGTTATVGVRLHQLNASGSIAEHRIECGGTDGVFSRWKSSAGDIGYYGQANVFIGGASSSNLGIASATGAITFGTGSTITERARITSGGYVKASNDGVYPYSSTAAHEIKQTANGTTLFLHNTNTGLTTNLFQVECATAAGTGWNFARFFANGVAQCDIRGDGNLYNTNGTYGTISDAAIKQDIVDAPSQWADLKAIQFRKYRLKDQVAQDANAPYLLGVVAQELEQVSPGLVDENRDGIKAVKSSILLMKAAVALQEAMARIETLEQRVLALEA